MSRYKGKNVPAIVSSVVSGIAGIIVIALSKGSIGNIFGLALLLLCIAGLVNYYKFAIVLDSSEIKITSMFKTKKIRYKDVIKIYTVKAGNTKITYIVDKYMDKNKWYIRGTYPPILVDQLSDANFNSLSDLMTINSYSFKDYKQMLKELSKKVPHNIDVDKETWQVINS